MFYIYGLEIITECNEDFFNMQKDLIQGIHEAFIIEDNNVLLESNDSFFDRMCGYFRKLKEKIIELYNKFMTWVREKFRKYKNKSNSDSKKVKEEQKEKKNQKRVYDNSDIKNEPSGVHERIKMVKLHPDLDKALSTPLRLSKLRDKITDDLLPTTLEKVTKEVDGVILEIDDLIKQMNVTKEYNVEGRVLTLLKDEQKFLKVLERRKTELTEELDQVIKNIENYSWDKQKRFENPKSAMEISQLYKKHIEQVKRLSNKYVQLLSAGMNYTSKNINALTSL